MPACECGCGQIAKKRFVHGHNRNCRLNEIRDCGDHAAIVARTIRGERLILVDHDDVERLSKLTWGVIEGRYAYHHSMTHGRFLIHQFILDRINADDGLVVDHINRDGLDNRRANLRVVTDSINSHNTKHQNKSGLRGASWCPAKKKYTAQVKINYRTIPLGRYDTPEEAHAVTMAYLRKHRLIPESANG